LANILTPGDVRVLSLCGGDLTISSEMQFIYFDESYPDIQYKEVQWMSCNLRVGKSTNGQSEIAYSSLFTKGEIVFMARAMLQLIIDPEESEERIGQHKSQINEVVQVTLEPNPSQNFVRANFRQFEKNTNRTVTLQLVDIFGKVVIQKEISSDNNYIDISNIPNGVYLYSVDLDQSKINKLIVRR
jgi:hypothetical protein